MKKYNISETVEIQVVIARETISRESFTLQVTLTVRQGCLYTGTSSTLTENN
jgi:hypothetical protein